MKFRGMFNMFNRTMSLILVMSFVLDVFGMTLVNLILLNPKVAEAAQVNIQSSPSTAPVNHTQSGAATVFVDDQIGYKFYRYGAAPSNGACVYQKTTNGGDTWGGIVVVDSQSDCISISVWYDRWTPGDLGTFIHISTIDTSADELYYNRLNTTDDSLLVPTSISANLAGPGTYAAGTNENSITKSTSGIIYMVADDQNGTSIRACSSLCELSVSWSNVGTPPQGNANSFSLLMPLVGGNVMLINRSTTNILRSSIWNGSTWSTFVTIDAAAIQNTTYDFGFSATVNTDSGDIFLAYAADNDNFSTADHDIRTAQYSSGAWVSKTDVLTNVAGRGVLQVAIARDQNNGSIYVVYTARSTIGTASSANVYWVRSTDSMTTWGAQQGPINTTASDIYGIDMNLMSYERLYASWYNDVGTQAIFGNTAADIGPEVLLTARGAQASQIRTNVSNFYIGGSYVLKSLSNQNVTNVTISENGTINAQNNLSNIKLYYDLDTSAPYDCVSESYAGSELQFGATVTGGFSGADGVAAFTNSPLSITATQAMCLYVVLDISQTAVDGDTLNVYVANPETDILLQSGLDVYPATPIDITDSTTVVDPNLTQNGYHWRLDNGTETTASSATGGTENTPINALQVGVPRRLRIGVVDTGSTTTLPSVYRLEYGSAAPTCEDVSSWKAIDDPTSVWNLFDSANLTNGNNTTDIAPSSGGVTNIVGTTFLSANGAVRDTTNNTGTLTLGVDQFFEAEYSIVASSTATEGGTYCFRMSRPSGPFSIYSNYPRVTIAADVLVQGYGTEVATADVLATSVYAGGGFRIIENSGSRNVTSLKFTEFGTIDATLGLSNLRVHYDSDTSAPYDCVSESYDGTEPQFGSTSVYAFDGPGETVTFTDSVGITTTSTLCTYLVYDVTGSARNGETIDVAIDSPTADVAVSGIASVGPSGQVNITGVTEVRGPNITQSHYHWRNDNGSETAATSATGANEDTALTDFSLNSPIRLRIGVENNGLVTTVPARYRLEYSPKITTCDTATVWTDVNSASDGWDMYNSTFLTNGETTTNISVANGGVSDGTGSFAGTNGGVRDTESETATTTLIAGDYTDIEFSITSTDFTAYNTTYCFRVSSGGDAFDTYTSYAEVTTSPKRDFKIQRGTTIVSGTSATLLAGTDYTALASTTLAFVRITSAHNTGAGPDTGTGAAQNADDVTAYISNPENIGTSFTIVRPATSGNNTRVDWEIIEFIGKSDTDNQIIVRGVGTLNYTSSDLVATGTVLSNVADDSKVVVFVTGASNSNTSRNYYAGQVTSQWDETTQSPVITRGATGGSVIDVSYAVVEFVGANWNVQRVEHAYSAAGVTETESITAVNSLAKTFLHTQKRMGANTQVVHLGHNVWLSSIGAVSFEIEAGAVVTGQVSVAWIIENIQSGLGAAKAQRSNGTTSGGSTPFSLSVILPTNLETLNNSSIFANVRADGANTTYPRPMAGFTITSTSTYEIWRSNTGAVLNYRVELYEWPVADLAIRQNYYRFYVDNNLLTPSDPWPEGVVDLGENTSITIADNPLGAGDRTRVRMTLRTANATMPAGFLNFKIQYGLRTSTCSAVAPGDWNDAGSAGGPAIWRGYAATGTVDGTSLSTNPPSGGDLLISVSDISGSLVHENPSVANPYSVYEGDNIEYDWYLEHNGALPQSTYCFRVVRSDGTPLSGYNNYPQIRTAGFTPVIRDWRWYGDVNAEPPVLPLESENITPIDVANSDNITLRVNVSELRVVQGDNTKFKLQFSEDVNFANPVDVASTSTCQDKSLWCYTEGAVSDNSLISNKVLTAGDTCVSGVGDGCGTYNTSPDYIAGHPHYAGVTQEYSFNIRHTAARVNAVYYFRLYNVTLDAPVVADSGYSYPSLVTEGPQLQFTLAGLPSGTTTAGVVTDVNTTPSGIGFGTLPLNTDTIAAHRVTVQTNATDGYQLFSFARQQLLSSHGESIPSISATNIVPDSWASACGALSTGCFGYHSTDSTLKDGSTRFAASDTYAGLETSPVEVMYSSIPSVDTHDIVYRIKVNQLQPAGVYETEIVYLAVPSY